MSKGLFGNMFDFDNDGKLNSFEQAAELGFIADCMDEDEDNRSEDYLDTDDIFDPDDYDYYDEDEYSEAFDEADYSWRDTWYDNGFSIDPDLYETELEFLDAIIKAGTDNGRINEEYHADLYKTEHDYIEYNTADMDFSEDSIAALESKISDIKKEIEANEIKINQLMKIRKDLKQ